MPHQEIVTSGNLKPIPLTSATSISPEEGSWGLGWIKPNRLGSLNNDLHHVSLIGVHRWSQFTMFYLTLPFLKILNLSLRWNLYPLTCQNAHHALAYDTWPIFIYVWPSRPLETSEFMMPAVDGQPSLDTWFPCADLSISYSQG